MGSKAKSLLIRTIGDASLSPSSMRRNRLFYVHMLQHLAIGEAAPLLILLGLSGPILRPILAIGTLQRLRWLLNPLVALPLWALNLYAWHFPALYEAALRNDFVHDLEHFCLFTAGMLMWGALIEPLPGPDWFNSGAKASYVLVIRALGCAVLANILIWTATPLYPAYRAGESISGISPLTDQQIGGGVMLIWGAFVTVALFSWLFLRWVGEGRVASVAS
jgi:putative membrane protein